MQWYETEIAKELTIILLAAWCLVGLIAQDRFTRLNNWIWSGSPILKILKAVMVLGPAGASLTFLIICLTLVHEKLRMKTQEKKRHTM